MPIQSHTLEQSLQANGGTHNVLRLFDQDAQQYMSSFFLPAGFDVAGLIEARIQEMDVQLEEREFTQIVEAD